MFWRLVVRNIRRNAWRSGLTAAGVALSVALLVWMHAYVDGMIGEMISGATTIDVGQVQIRRSDWGDKPKVDEAFEPGRWASELEGAEGVSGVIPKLEFWGLLGTEKHSEVTRYIGVDPVAARSHTPIEEAVVAGEWLPETSKRGMEAGGDTDNQSDGSAVVVPSPVVMGAGLAERIGVEVGDEVVVFAGAADGSLGNDLLRVHGLVETGKTSIDRRGAFLMLEEAQFVAALEGRIHEFQIMTDNVRQADDVAGRLRSIVPASVSTAGEAAELEVQSWRQSNPQLANMIDMSSMSIWMIYAIVYLLAALGIVNAQRMSALERRREFGVMQSIGMTPQRLFGIVMFETVVLSLFGAWIGAVLGGSVAWYHATYGLSMSTFSSLEQFSYMGVTFSEQIYFSLSLEAFVWPVGVLLVVSVICGVWPASWAANVDPAAVMAGRD
jgi:ABC-type lipoprotein release transport system permease subunit